jgi:tRNA(fMet)-specific endonuclease VapC
MIYLLDTNHCSRVLENDAAVLQRLAALGDAMIATCAIVRGELIFMAEFSQQRTLNLRRVETLLSRITVYSIDGEVADWYGSLKARLLDRFGPKAKAKRRRATLVGIGVSDNDLWVAAVARRHGCAIVSNDSDFARIAEVTDLAVETWWTPQIQP